MWSTTRRVGCAWNYNQNGQHQKFMGVPFSLRPFWVCQYSPGGNVPGWFQFLVIPPWRSYLDCPPSKKSLLVAGAPDPGRALCFTKRSLVASQGDAIHLVRGKGEGDCELLCKQHMNCQSFKLCGTTCTLYNAAISESTPAALPPQDNCHSYLVVKCVKCFYARSLVADEGDRTATPIEPFSSIEECSSRCAMDAKCNSYAVCHRNSWGNLGGGCWFKTKTVTLGDVAAPMTKEKWFRQCATYYQVNKTQEEIDQQKCTSTTTTPDPCPWTTPHWYETTDPLCEDGQLDKVCVKRGHGQVLRCSQPRIMCAEKCDQDYCCETDCSSKGGNLTCHGSRVYPPLPTPAPPTPSPTPPEVCPWLTAHTEASPYAKCNDGSFSWTCVNGGRGQRIKCPPSHPQMCDNLGCGGGKDYCCEKNCDGKGGPRPCPSPHPTPAPGKCPWKGAHNGSVQAPKCTDGNFTWNCRQGGHGQRIQCPLSQPDMCAELGCGADGEDHCCEKDCASKGGLRCGSLWRFVAIEVLEK